MGSKVPASRVDAFLVKKLIQDLVIDCTNSTQVVISQGSVAGADDGETVMEAAGNLTADITASGINGLDTGVEAIDTWYYIYMIFNPDTDAVASLLSASATTPTLPAGYLSQRRVGAVRNDGSSNFKTFTQRGAFVTYDIRQAFVAGGTNTAYTQISLVSVVPTLMARSFGARIYMVQPSYSGSGAYISIDGVQDSVGHAFGIIVGVPGNPLHSEGLTGQVCFRNDSIWYRVTGAVSPITTSMEVYSYEMAL